MRGRTDGMMVVAYLGTVAAMVLAPGPARAQPVTCPAPGENAATVVIATPEAGAAVGGRVEVKGRAEGPTLLFQVELFVGDSRKDFVVLDPPAETTDFTLSWDAGPARAGPATIHVVTCGGTTEFGQLIRGSASVEVQVDAPPTAPPVSLSEGEEVATGERPSIVAGAVIAIPAAACLVYAMGRRRSSASPGPSPARPRDPS